MGACRTTSRAILSGGRGGGVATTTLCGALPDHREERSEAVAHGQLKPILVPHADTPRWYPAFADRAPSVPACVCRLGRDDRCGRNLPPEPAAVTLTPTAPPALLGSGDIHARAFEQPALRRTLPV